MMYILGGGGSALAEGASLIEIFETIIHNSYFNIGLLIILAIIGGQIAHLFKLPHIIGYILVGIFFGPSFAQVVMSIIEGVPLSEVADVEGVFSHTATEFYGQIAVFGIGIIGYIIGIEIKIKKIKQFGKEIIVITLAQAFATAVLVSLAIGTFICATKGSGSFAWTYALILGAIATATAPGEVLALVKAYRTKGPVTDTLLPLVAFDDAVGIMIFAVCLSVGTSLLGTSGAGIVSVLWSPLKVILLSFGIGGFMGAILVFSLNRLKRECDELILMLIIGFVLGGIGIAKVVGASPILLPLSIGFAISNFLNEKYVHRIVHATEFWTAPILLVFFTYAGLELDLTMVASAGVIAIIYIVFRMLGKVMGTKVSAKAMKSKPTIQKYLGWALLPQAGVAVDMAVTTFKHFESMAHEMEVGTLVLEGITHTEVYNIGLNIQTIALSSTIVFALLGVAIAKKALEKAGEIDQDNVGWGIPK